jgi:hypothetical protein
MKAKERAVGKGGLQMAKKPNQDKKPTVNQNNSNNTPPIKTAHRDRQNSFLIFLQGLFGDKKSPATTQETIPYKEIRKDGIAVLGNGIYSKTIEFFDINYHLAHEDDQMSIFEAYSKVLNYFDDTMQVQLSFINSYVDLEEIRKGMSIFARKNKSKLHREFADMLKNQLEKGNNGLEKRKFITVTVKSKNIVDAKSRLERIETDTVNNLKRLGAKASSLTGVERLAVLYKQLNPGNNDSLNFDYAKSIKTGLGTKDFIAPTSFDFRGHNSFRVGGQFCAAYFMEVKANQLDDKILKDLLEADASLSITIHIKALDQEAAIRLINRRLSDFRQQKIERQRKLSGEGIDMDTISPELIENELQTKELLTDLTKRDERMFMTTIIIVATAESQKKLNDILGTLKGIARQQTCPLRPLDFAQEQGYMSSLVLRS